MTLSLRRRRFVDEYLIDFNATEAMKRVGFKGRRPDIAGSTMLAEPAVKAELAKISQASLERAGVKIERILLELAAMGFSDPRRLIDPATGRMKHPKDWDAETAAAIESFELSADGQVTRVKMQSKSAALTLLGRYFAIWKDNIDVTGEITHRYVVVAPPRAKSTAEWLSKIESRGLPSPDLSPTS